MKNNIATTVYASVKEALANNLWGSVAPIENEAYWDASNFELRNSLSQSIWDKERQRLESLLLDKISCDLEVSDWGMLDV